MFDMCWQDGAAMCCSGDSPWWQNSQTENEDGGQTQKVGTDYMVLLQAGQWSVH